jgi:hypothetical protein
MYYKGSNIKSSADYMALGKDDFFVLDHQRVKDSEGRLTEVWDAPTALPHSS